MSWSCIIDGEPVDLHTSVVRTRRRGQGKCGSCGHPIVPGDRYREIKHLYEGSWWRKMDHVDCDELMSQAARLICEDGFYDWDSNLAGASKELLAANLSRYGDVSDEQLRNWLIQYEEVLDRHEPESER
jgi:hypothetical protein